MFTGIIEEVGRILSLRRQGDGARVSLGCRKILDDLQLGASVCVSGICLTATETGPDRFSADVSAETLSRTSLGSLSAGAAVNLERAMQPQGRLGGHLMNGHVDSVGRVLGVPAGGGPGTWEFSLPEELGRYVVEKGSIAVDGISLTVAGLAAGRFSVAIIPATVSGTNLGEKRVGDPVNLEVDILAKYVENLLSNRQTGAEPGTLARTLEEYEYLT
jgi:riboflavin synthase